MPRPSEITTVGVSAPGPMNVADREPHDGRAHARRVARRKHHKARDQPQQRKHRRRSADEDQRDLAVVGREHRECRQHRDGDDRRDDVAFARQARSGATSPRNSAEAGTSWARPSGHSANATAIRTP